MVVTGPRPRDSSRHNPGFVVLSPSYRRSWPVALQTEPQKCCCWHRVAELRHSVPIARLVRNPFASYASVRHGERRPSPNTSPRLSQPALLVHFLLPPATSVQCITHPPLTRAGVLQCPAWPRHCADNIESIRLGRPKDHSAPHRPPRCVLRAL